MLLNLLNASIIFFTNNLINLICIKDFFGMYVIHWNWFSTTFSINRQNVFLEVLNDNIISFINFYLFLQIFIAKCIWYL